MSTVNNSNSYSTAPTGSTGYSTAPTGPTSYSTAPAGYSTGYSTSPAPAPPAPAPALPPVNQFTYTPVSQIPKSSINSSVGYGGGGGTGLASSITQPGGYATPAPASTPAAQPTKYATVPEAYASSTNINSPLSEMYSTGHGGSGSGSTTAMAAATTGGMSLPPLPSMVVPPPPHAGSSIVSAFSPRYSAGEGSMSPTPFSAFSPGTQSRMFDQGPMFDVSDALVLKTILSDDSWISPAVFYQQISNENPKFKEIYERAKAAESDFIKRFHEEFFEAFSGNHADFINCINSAPFQARDELAFLLVQKMPENKT